MRNNNSSLYKNIRSTRVQIFGDLSAWTSKLCFLEGQRHVGELQLWFSPTSVLSTKVNFDRIQNEG